MPESTYRLQFHAGFTFDDAQKIVPYLRALGITHLYASPILQATPESTHGYDIIDHNQLNPSLGGRAAFDRLCATLQQHGMGVLLDTVPNHMGIATNDNRLWNDVLEHGRQSRYADFFDITWDASPRFPGKVLLPVLADHYGAVLDRGEIRVIEENGRHLLVYHDRRFPLNPARQPQSLDDLDNLLQQQHYRLAYWRTASDEINYRRFFDINDLAALRMERPDAFDHAHRLTLELVRNGQVQGLRIDHPDGLYDPAAYFARLRNSGVHYLVAEKILAADEQLVEHWPIAGASGYDALIAINGLFVDPSSESALTHLFQQFTGDHDSYATIAWRCKLLILDVSLASELHMLSRQLDSIAQSDRHTRDLTFTILKESLRQMIACFPVYRTYITADTITDTDRRVVDQALATALQRNPDLDPAGPTLVRNALLLSAQAPRDAQVAFAGRFQQLSAPATAKGIEDTAFYRYNRLVSLNEVGGNPSRFGLSPDSLHRFFQHRQKHWPYAMSALSTHDTKRGEDVRARINVLSELPDLWRQHVLEWRELNRPHRLDPDQPTANDEYLLYQTLVGAWPVADDPTFAERITAYLRKAAREAKQNSSWTRPSESYENALTHFAGRILDPLLAPDFLASFTRFHSRIAWLGAVNSLAQTTLRLTAPGVPDTYQGSELWDLSLVDPDNRRPVDYAIRDQLLRNLDAHTPAHLLSTWRDGAIKLLVTSRLLNLRRQHPGLFSTGQYSPLNAGPNLFAFAREDSRAHCVVIVPRLIANIARAIDDLRLTHHLPLPPRRYTDVLTNQPLPPSRALDISDVLNPLPVAVLLHENP